MPNLIVVNDPEDWPLDVADSEVVAARAYLTDPRYIDLPHTRVYNLCRQYRYQKTGYYVSLLAEARGHRPMPGIGTIQDLKSQSVLRVAAEDLEELIEKSLAPIHSPEFVLSVYFGHNVARRHDALAAALFRAYHVPFLRAWFEKHPRTGRWAMTSVSTIGYGEIPEEHRPLVLELTREFLATRRRSAPRRTAARYDLAILHNPDEVECPSDERALRRFQRAGESVGLDVDLIQADDFDRLGEFDALFIRETTGVNHRTYRFAQKAQAQGLVVVDDPDSILKCSNKVFLAEVLDRHNLRAPKTMIVHKGNAAEIEATLGLPCILKQPDSSFSQGVVKAETRADLERDVERLLEKSDLIIAQEFLPTEFDWRVGVFDRQPLFVCRYFMARRHWQIIKREQNGEKDFGRAETLSVEMAPTKVVKTALKAANLFGDGLYGVDLKQQGKDVYVIEVNDNPNIDAGIEDAVIKDELYLRIMRVFLNRIDRRRKPGAYS